MERPISRSAFGPRRAAPVPVHRSPVVPHLFASHDPTTVSRSAPFKQSDPSGGALGSACFAYVRSCGLRGCSVGRGYYLVSCAPELGPVCTWT
ncbi:hypothetical protein HMPREF9004_0397 [Schaalia cardiffensis F0333]|uniref:Uncharacterized protein n=1 Tax=Schaalia cardiffensis F0333 TaxID=888050 RepID=N6X5U8_9ACTO|nr:hypothetical protein HMPREF9004_0397 [Schaalia cardiffensis F0333]